MLNAADLALALPTLTPQTRQGHGYRIVDYQYFAALPNLHPVRILYGFGAPINGQRFTPRGGMATIYFAEDLATAFDEVHPEQAIIRQHDPGLVSPVSPGGFATIQYSLETVLNATDPVVQQRLGTDMAELAGHWRQARNRGQTPPTQRLGQAVYDSRLFQAIWYESARVPGTYCLAVFPDRLTAPSFLEVYDPAGNFQEHIP
jgi:RES domain-containing protein